jgi:hypothetical protein
VLTPTQNNITQVGTLTNLTVDGNVVVNSNPTIPTHATNEQIK